MCKERELARLVVEVSGELSRRALRRAVLHQDTVPRRCAQAVVKYSAIIEFDRLGDRVDALGQAIRCGEEDVEKQCDVEEKRESGRHDCGGLVEGLPNNVYGQEEIKDGRHGRRLQTGMLEI